MDLMKPEEPWLRGILRDQHPVIAHLLRASEQTREDSAGALDSLSAVELWSKPHGMTSAGFHAKHLAGSTNRLCTYLEGGELSAEQVRQSLLEGTGEEAPGALRQVIEAAFDRYDAIIRALHPEQFDSVRYVGRKRLPVTSIGLAIHIAEHGQRHVGQLISAAKLARAK